MFTRGPTNQTAAALQLDAATLLRGQTDAMVQWLESLRPRQFAFPALMICLGAGAYGSAMGLWRSPLQAGFVAIKFPLVILITSVSTSMINGMIAPLLGVNITLRQCAGASALALAIASLILGSLSLIAAFLTWNIPPLGEPTAQASLSHSLLKLFHVAAIAGAGVVSHLRLWQLLFRLSGSRPATLRVLLCWLGTNLFVGSQLTWILRPFIGSPWLPVEFVRSDALKGNFYETVLHDLLRLF
ncbi:MAG: hypothetical protein FJ405_17255 [Verrucomicrobia bacterium]|nr:hypothetical protein [Verrucomicrobiota bacterium]